MIESGAGPSMSQEIFKRGFPVETVSLYLAAAGLLDAGKALTLENFRSVWSGSDESLERALAELTDRNILGPAGEGYEMLDASRWK